MSKGWISIAGVVLFLALVFCAGFFFFYHQRVQQPQTSDTEPAKTKSLIDKPLPESQLVDGNGTRIDEGILRKGRVILVFVTTDCDACLTEGKFLQTLIDRRKDVNFYGLVPFGKSGESVAAAKRLFPFEVFYDQNDAFVFTLGINRVPVKVFLEDGIIKKGWIGAAITEEARKSFVEWLDSLPQA